jgi:hypothetical protein
VGEWLIKSNHFLTNFTIRFRTNFKGDIIPKRKEQFRLSIDESVILGHYLLHSDAGEDQDDIMVEALLQHDQRDLLDKIADKRISKYEFNFLIDSVDGSDGVFWSTVLKEIINVYSLNTLKNFLDDSLDTESIVNVIGLLKYLKGRLPDINIYDEKIPTTRDALVGFLTRYGAPHWLMFAINTIDNYDLSKFVEYFITP